MRVAVLLTGNLRSWRLCGQVLKNCLLSRYDCDVFMSVDLDNTLQCVGENPSSFSKTTELEEAINFYKPIKVYSGCGYTENLFESISSDIVHIVPEAPCPEVSLKGSAYHIMELAKNANFLKAKLAKESLKILFEQYFYCKKAYELLEAHMKEQTVSYDLVLRIRFDQLLWSDADSSPVKFFQTNSKGVIYSEKNIEIAKSVSITFQLDEPEVDEICVFGCGVHHNYVYVNDQFWAHGPDMIAYIKNFYSSLPVIIDSCSTSYPFFGASIEHFFFLYLRGKKIMRSKLSGIFVRLNNGADI